MPFLHSFDDHENASTTSKTKVDRRKQLKSVARIVFFVGSMRDNDSVRSTLQTLRSPNRPDVKKPLSFIFETWYIQHTASTSERYNDNLDNALHNLHWYSPEIWNERQQSLVKNALPVPVHSHNDYLQRIPLWEALGSGCISVEADIHFKNSNLLVGHNSQGLDKTKTLRAMYLDPLQKLIALRNKNINRKGHHWNGIFDKAPQQSIVLLIDLKTSAEETFAELNAQLQPLRNLNFLTHWNGTHRVERPLTIVASGNTLFTSILSLNSSHRDILFDADATRLVSQGDDWTDASAPIFKFNVSNSYYASTKVADARVRKYDFPEGSEQERSLMDGSNPQFVDAMESQLKQAKVRGLVTRYWDVPTQKNKQESLWRWLMDNEVGVLNMDDMGVVRDRARGWSNLMSRSN